MNRFIKAWIAVVFLCTAMSHATDAVASLADEVDVTVERFIRAELSLENERLPARRAALFEEALQAVETLHGLALAPIGSPEAREALNLLASEGVSRDGLRLELVGALIDRLIDEQLGLDVEARIRSSILEIKDPAYRAAGWLALARVFAEQKDQADEADRLAHRAVDDAKLISEEGTKDGALQAAALVSRGGAKGRIAAIATSEMQSAARRAGTYRQLAKGRIRKNFPSPDQILAVLAAKPSRDVLVESLAVVQALDRSAENRKAVIDALIQAALEMGFEELAIEAAKSIDDTGAQDAALREIIDVVTEAGRPLRSIDLVKLLIKPKSKVDAVTVIADRLEEDGYRKAAVDLLKRTVPLAEGDERHVGKLSVGLADAGDEPGALQLAATLSDETHRSFAFSRIVKRLADEGDIERAQAHLHEATRSDDRSFASSGLARALARAGKVDEARALLDDIQGEADRSRALEAIAKAHVKAGNMEAGRETIALVQKPAARSRSLVSLALALEASRRSEAIASLESALDALGGDADGEDLANVAMGFARLGDVARAEVIIAGIKDREARDDAVEAVTKLMLQRQSFRDATNWAERIVSAEKRSRASADIVLAGYGEDRNLERVVDAVQALPFKFRVATLRRVAEAEARALDEEGRLADKQVSTAVISPARQPVQADFRTEMHRVRAPAAPAIPPEKLQIPNVFAPSADASRRMMPAPGSAESVFYSALLGFSPFDNEAFKLTGKGQPAIYPLQVSQALTWPRYIAIEKGVVTLGDILRNLPEASAHRLLERSGDTITIRAPIVVLPDATLVMAGAEFGRYQLSATAGAYISVAGRLHVQDADIVGFDENTGAPSPMSDERRAEFRPYLVGWSGSNMVLAGSRFANLGYDARKAYGITLSTGPDTADRYRAEPRRPTAVIVDNSFEELRYGFYSYEADDVELIGNEYRDNIVYGIDPHDRSRRLVIGLNTAYGTKKKHGIIVSREVDDSFIVGNLSLRNAGSGIMLDRTSIRNVVYANTAAANDGDGLTFFESGCNVAASNALVGNERAGVKVRNSDLVGIYNNLLEGNGGSAVDVYISELESSTASDTRDFALDPYHAVSRIAVGRNQISANAAGVNAAGASSIILQANRFVDQKSRLFSGDLLSLSPFLLQLSGETSVAVRTTCQPPPVIEACNFAGWHMLEEQMYSTATGVTYVSNDCTDVPGTPQEDAVTEQSTSG